MAELIEMPFRLWTQMGPTKHVLHGGAPWCNMANMIEPPCMAVMWPFCQIALTTC